MFSSNAPITSRLSRQQTRMLNQLRQRWHSLRDFSGPLPAHYVRIERFKRPNAQYKVVVHFDVDETLSTVKYKKPFKIEFIAVNELVTLLKSLPLDEVAFIAVTARKYNEQEQSCNKFSVEAILKHIEDLVGYPVFIERSYSQATDKSPLLHVAHTTHLPPGTPLTNSVIIDDCNFNLTDCLSAGFSTIPSYVDHQHVEALADFLKKSLPNATIANVAKTYPATYAAPDEKEEGKLKDDYTDLLNVLLKSEEEKTRVLEGFNTIIKRQKLISNETYRLSVTTIVPDLKRKYHAHYLKNMNFLVEVLKAYRAVFYHQHSYKLFSQLKVEHMLMCYQLETINRYTLELQEIKNYAQIYQDTQVKLANLHAMADAGLANGEIAQNEYDLLLSSNSSSHSTGKRLAECATRFLNHHLSSQLSLHIQNKDYEKAIVTEAMLKEVTDFDFDKTCLKASPAPVLQTPLKQNSVFNKNKQPAQQINSNKRLKMKSSFP